MRSDASREGYLLIDHTNSPGVDAETARALRVAPVAAGKRAEFKTKTCAHCGVAVMMNPDRTRARGSCSKCGKKYVCDVCAKLGDCRPIAALADAIAGSDKVLSPFSSLILRS